ncbi:phosphomevalonate kinase [Bacillus niameyensis]|uniref:phosphomevalonate kinase n=1 Tax=Bacillus niameyensis TaxID=1522308 RepID=UPI0007829FCE|nr:phosphomevalonate kinase [Bacillus niameyensis]
MSQPTYHLKVPGKLFIAGEYAVTEPGQPSVVIAVDRFLNAKITSSEQNHLYLAQLGLDDVIWQAVENDLEFSESSAKLSFIRSAITIFNKLLKEYSIEQRPFSLSIKSDLDDPSGKKYGLGSSAAVVVAVITALIHFYDEEKIPPEKELIFKLAAISHFMTQGNGSCADIAAATYGGWIHYTTFDAEWLLNQLETGKPISQFLEEAWPKLKIQPLIPPTNLKLCVGWTGKSAATGPMVHQVHQLKTENLEFYQQFLDKSAEAVNDLLRSFAENNSEEAIFALKKNREALLELDQYSKAGIETITLKTLIQIAEIYGSGKSSGAGGGDCGIAFVNDEVQVEKLKKEWAAASIDPLYLNVTETGASISIEYE